MNSFHFYDGDSGKSYKVVSFIPDNQQTIKADQDELDIIRFEGEGGKTRDGAKLARDVAYHKDWEHHVKKEETKKKRKRKRQQQKNYIMFGYKG